MSQYTERSIVIIHGKGANLCLSTDNPQFGLDLRDFWDSLPMRLCNNPTATETVANRLCKSISELENISSLPEDLLNLYIINLKAGELKNYEMEQEAVEEQLGKPVQWGILIRKGYPQNTPSREELGIIEEEYYD